jgi:hypothetical protein
MATATEEPLVTEKDTEPLTEVALLAHKTAQPETVDQRMTVRQSTVLGQAPTWLHTNLRSLIAIALTGLICWLGLTGNKDAMTALIAAFSVLMGAIWGERAALKVPGQDA